MLCVATVTRKEKGAQHLFCLFSLSSASLCLCPDCCSVLSLLSLQTFMWLEPPATPTPATLRLQEFILFPALGLSRSHQEASSSACFLAASSCLKRAARVPAGVPEKTYRLVVIPHSVWEVRPHGVHALQGTRRRQVLAERRCSRIIQRQKSCVGFGQTGGRMEEQSFHPSTISHPV